MGEDLPQPFGSYTLHDLVARGGMAEIYRATMPGIGGFEKTVAIKKILPHLAENEEFITMLIDEARIIVSINHSNIAQVYDLGKIEDTYYIAMEYIHGIDISHVIKKLKKRGEYIPMDHVAYIGSCICAGLHAAHSKTDENGNPLNIVHRDVSPHNVLISYAGDVKIIDFGVAKATVKETHTKMGVIKGKLLYMAPEQAMAKDLDGRADLFAVGLCLYKMLTHELPFAGDNEFQIYNNILSKEIVPPKQLNPDVPEELNQIVMTLLQRDPDKRYQDGYAAKQDLDRCLHNIAPGYTINRLSRFIEDNFSKAGQDQASEADNSNEASHPQGIAPSTPSSNEVDTGQITAERRSDKADVAVEGDPTVNLSRGEALGELEPVREPAGQASGSDEIPGPPALPDEPMSDGPARTQTSTDATGEFGASEAPADEDASSKGIPPVVYAIGVMIAIIAGMSAYAVMSGSTDDGRNDRPGDEKAIATSTGGSETVSIQLNTDPDGATVLVDGKDMGQTPAEFDLDKSNKPVTIAFERQDYETKRVRLVPNSSIDRVIALTREFAAEESAEADAGGADTGSDGELADRTTTEGQDAPGEESGGREPETGEDEPSSGSPPDRDSSGKPRDEEPEEPKDEPESTPEVREESADKPKQKASEPEEKDSAETKEDKKTDAEASDDSFIPVLGDDEPADDEKKDEKNKEDEGLIDPFG